jgi:hypothetical protein
MSYGFVGSTGYAAPAVDITNLRAGSARGRLAEQGIRLSIMDDEFHAERDLNANRAGNHVVFGGKNATNGQDEMDGIFGFQELAR